MIKPKAQRSEDRSGMPLQRGPMELIDPSTRGPVGALTYRHQTFHILTYRKFLEQDLNNCIALLDNVITGSLHRKVSKVNLSPFVGVSFGYSNAA
eukprot:1595743-Amphidinium_carterae.1